MKNSLKSVICIIAISMISCIFALEKSDLNSFDHEISKSEYNSKRFSLVKNDKIPIFNFELSRYLGQWYEQARLPTFFQRNCDSSTAHYSLNKDGSIKVLNTCYRIDGSSNSISGKAKIDHHDISGRSLIVSFNFFTDIINYFKGVNYYVYSIDESYSNSIVGTPKKDMLWILTRDKIIDQENLENLIHLAKNLGFDTSKFIYDKR